jgi:hypothetical protein
MPRNRAASAFVGSLFAIVTVLTSALSAITIDDFSQGNVTLTDTYYRDRASNLQTGLSRSHTLNTARYLTFEAAAPAPYTGTGIATVSVDNGSWKLSGDPGVSAVNLFSIYGDTRYGLPPMSLNLAAYGATSLVIDFDYAIPDPKLTFNGFYLDISLNSTISGGSAYVYQPVPVSSTPFSDSVPLTKFLTATPTFDLNHVTRMTIGTGNGNMRGAFAISKIWTNSTSELISGDFNFNSRVDAADYITWRNGYPQLYSTADLQAWRANFGAQASLSAARVPESSTSVLTAIAAYGLFASRHIWSSTRQLVPSRNSIGLA